MSGGRLKIEVFASGQIMKAFDCFDATSKGTIEAFMGTSSYWATLHPEPAFQWFMSVPFGMDPQGMAAWYYQADGRKLMDETYAPFNVVPRQGPSFAPQMGGWFRKKINVIGDYKGLRMRIAGLGGTGGHQGRRLGRRHAGRRHLRRPGKRRHRRVRVGRAARRHEARGCRTPHATTTTRAGTSPAR